MGNRIFTGLVEEKEKYIGGKMLDFGDSMDRIMISRGIIDGPVPLEATITDISIKDNFFSVDGEPFRCGCDMNHLHVTRQPEFGLKPGGIAFSGYQGHEWHIYPNL